MRQHSLVGHRHTPTEALASICRRIYQITTRDFQHPLVVAQFAGVIDGRRIHVSDLAIPPSGVSADVWQLRNLRQRNERSPDDGTGELCFMVGIDAVSDRLRLCQ
jgi:hypothetical protein